MTRGYHFLLIALCGVLGGTALAAQEPKNADELVARMEQMAAGLHDYEVRGDGVSDGKKQHFKFYFLAPALVRIDSDDGQVAVQPNGEIRGRLGKGVFGSISRKLDRSDKRLRDSEGIPFWDSHYAASVAHIRQQMRGATTNMSSDQGSYYLEIRSGSTTWKYVVDKATFFYRENSRWVNGKVVEDTHYSEFRPNTGMKESRFKF